MIVGAHGVFSTSDAGRKANVPGLGSVNNDDSDNNTFEIVSAGLHWSFKISRQILPFALMLG